MVEASGWLDNLRRTEKLTHLLPIGNPSSVNNWDTTSAISVDHQSGEATNRVAVHSIDGTGIHGNAGQYHAGGGPTHTMYLSRNVDGLGGMPQNSGQTPGSHYITYAFDRVYNLDAIWLWNWNESGYLQLGWKHIDVQISTTNGSDPSDWTTVYSGIVQQATGFDNSPPSLELDVGGRKARYVAFINTGEGPEQENHSHGEFTNDCGIAEVRFYETGRPY